MVAQLQNFTEVWWSTSPSSEVSILLLVISSAGRTKDGCKWYNNPTFFLLLGYTFALDTHQLRNWCCLDASRCQMPDQSTEASTFPLPPATPPSVPPSYSTLPRPFLIRHGQSMGNAVDRKLFAILGTLLSSRSSLRRADYWSPAPCSPTPRVRVKNEPC